MRHFSRRIVRILFQLVIMAAALFGGCGQIIQAQRLVAARTAAELTDATNSVDTGAVAASQPMSLTLRLTPSNDRAAALEQLLVNQRTPTSPAFHHWLTPQQYAAGYGASDEQIATTTQWLQSQGLTVKSVSPTRTRIGVSGNVDRVQQAFSISLRSYAVAGIQRYASRGLPVMPQAIAPSIAEVSGLDDMPAIAKTRVVAVSSAGVSTLLSTEGADPLDAVAAAVDANIAPILTITSSDCTVSPSSADYEAYRALFRQASAQGMTVLTSTSCDDQKSTSAETGNLAEATAVVTTPLSAAMTAADPRPGWQAAIGLPKDGLRHSPDLAVSSVDDLAQTMAQIVEETGSSQGNINATLYSLATTPDLYTQDDGSSGTWETSTGLGRVNLQTLLKVYPRATGAISTTTSLTADNYAVSYGTAVTFTSNVLPSSYASSNPSGTVTFTSGGAAIGSAQLNNGTATFKIGGLDVGTYTVIASYSGDSNYAASSSTSSVVITISIVNATIKTTVAPAQNVPYGATATVTATVTMPTASAAPSGTVTATMQSVTNATATATLSPNPGGNSATANIVLNAPKKGTYTIETSCSGNKNFQCQSPSLITNFTTVKGYTTTTITTSPQSPQAGEPVTIVATINNAGNGTDTYSFGGSVSFYDNGVLLATAPVATNIATISKSLSGNVQHSIVAKYTGDDNWNASTSTAASVQPTLLPSTLTLTSNTSTTLSGINFILTATVYTTATSAVGPTGNIVFYDTFNGSVLQLGTPTPVIPNGPNQSIAVFSTTGLLAGAHSIYAVYNGDANFSTATAATLPITVSDFTITKVPGTLTLKAGQTGKAVLLLGTIGGFGGSVTFGCTPPPSAQITCSFNPVTLNGGGSTTLQIVTTATPSTTKTAFRTSPIETWNALGGTTLAVLIWFIRPARRCSLPKLFILLAGIVITANLGCGSGKEWTSSDGSSSSSTADTGTPLGTQSITITTAGTDGANTVRHTDQFQVTVQ